MGGLFYGGKNKIRSACAIKYEEDALAGRPLCCSLRFTGAVALYSPVIDLASVVEIPLSLFVTVFTTPMPFTSHSVNV